MENIIKKITKYLGVLGAILLISGCKPKFEGEKFTMLNWNMQAFGESKAKHKDLMRRYTEVIKKYDIAFLQEIRDEKGLAFEKLCSELGGYDYKISSRAGKSECKEQYGVVFRKNIRLYKFDDLNPKFAENFERPPIRADFICGCYTVRVYNIHIKPSNVYNELKSLEKITSDSGNVVLMGDLNASGSYYNPKKQRNFGGWFWAIADDEDTTSGKTRCAYDRIIMNKDAKREYLRHGIQTDTTKRESDHYPVWVEMAAKEL